MTGLGRLALAPRTVRVDESALTVTRYAPLLHVCGLVAPGRGLLTATVTNGYARALGVTTCDRTDCNRGRLAVARPGLTARSHTGPTTGHVTALLLLTVCGLGRAVGSLDGVAGIAQRLLLLPAITATLGRQ